MAAEPTSRILLRKSKEELVELIRDRGHDFLTGVKDNR